jgi:hypothetical protein
LVDRLSLDPSAGDRGAGFGQIKEQPGAAAAQPAAPAPAAVAPELRNRDWIIFLPPGPETAWIARRPIVIEGPLLHP